MKKKSLLIIMLIAAFAAVMPVHAQSITNACTNISTEIDVKLPDTVHKIILVIQIAVPVLLVIFGMLDLFKGITAQKEDEIKKGQQTLIKRLIAAAIVFFVIVIVKLLVGFVAGDDKDDIFKCASCFINGFENISDGTCKTW